MATFSLQFPVMLELFVFEGRTGTCAIGQSNIGRAIQRKRKHDHRVGQVQIPLSMQQEVDQYEDVDDERSQKHDDEDSLEGRRAPRGVLLGANRRIEILRLL